MTDASYELDMEALFEFLTGTIEACTTGSGPKRVAERLNLALNIAKWVLTDEGIRRHEEVPEYLERLQRASDGFAEYVKRIPAYYALEIQREFIATGHAACHDCPLCTYARRGAEYERQDAERRQEEEAADVN